MNKELTPEETRDAILDGNWLPWIDESFLLNLDDYIVWINENTVERFETIL